ncbi:MAG: hypothetical protein NTU94_05090 [Planctomycetota bacterium]|nr:hypothetical protein [Planctomycetota bacterium]
MRPATKHWLLLAFLVLSLAAMVAFALWQIGKARREGPAPKSAAMAGSLVRGGSPDLPRRVCVWPLKVTVSRGGSGDPPRT